MEKCACKGSFLERFTQPAVLVLLSREPLHGFSICKKLAECDFFDFNGIDPTGLYRMLKKMEESGLLASEWNTEDVAYAKRVYQITEKGKRCLENWGETLRRYRDSISKLIGAVNESTGGWPFCQEKN